MPLLPVSSSFQRSTQTNAAYRMRHPGCWPRHAKCSISRSLQSDRIPLCRPLRCRLLLLLLWWWYSLLCSSHCQLGFKIIIKKNEHIFGDCEMLCFVFVFYLPASTNLWTVSALPTAFPSAIISVMIWFLNRRHSPAFCTNLWSIGPMHMQNLYCWSACFCVRFDCSVNRSSALYKYAGIRKKVLNLMIFVIINLKNSTTQHITY